jgi:hypothetical protein
MSKKIIKTAARIIFGFIMLCIVLFLTYAGWFEYSMYKPLMTKTFDSQSWKLAEKKVWYSEFKIDGQVIQSGPDVALERRCGMYHDLIKNYLKKGMTIKEVENLLGPIDHWYYYKSDKQKCTGYHMGICYSNAITVVPMILFTCFNKRENLIRFGRGEPDKHIGVYDIKNKEQQCFKEGPGGVGIPSNYCGIQPW